MPAPNTNTNKPNDFKQAEKKIEGDATQTFRDTSNVIEAWFAQGREQFDRLSQTYGQQEQFAAFTKSGNAVARGVEEFFKTYASFAQDMANRNAEGFKTLLGSRSLTDAQETQSRLLQDNSDSLLSNATTLLQLGVRVATDALEPISSQVSGALRKGSRAA